MALRRYLRQAAALQAKFKDSDALAQYQQALKLDPQQLRKPGGGRPCLSVGIGNRYSDETRKKAYFGAARGSTPTAPWPCNPPGGESNYAMALALFSERPAC
ncbi:MAG: hypothetical protein WKG07_48675 [Hymenobacter sp.]